ncbi:AraC family transcriptional regulator [Dokdonia sp.]|uniref:helix-turn-helix domain-containing protein n=1 Tax=Dokdonia sp. TaxID=2024995 RepID=UPI003264EFE3
MGNNFIIHQHAKEYQWSGECFLSIKSFYHGEANYQVKQREYCINQTNFLLLNECTKYRLTIDAPNETESFCVFFSPEFVSDVVSELYSSEKQLLDFNFKKTTGIKLFERNYVHIGIVSDLLKHGKTKSKIGMSNIEKDEFYNQLLTTIIHQNTRNSIDYQKLKFKKKSTRLEIYQRILYVKDYIDCNYTKDIRLKELTAIGFLSENHLLRNFKEIFMCTPFQYISQKRIKEAQRQLLETSKAIKDIAFEVGYVSLGNFSHYFKSITGTSPSVYRKK